MYADGTQLAAGGLCLQMACSSSQGGCVCRWLVARRRGDVCVDSLELLQISCEVLNIYLSFICVMIEWSGVAEAERPLRDNMSNIVIALVNIFLHFRSLRDLFFDCWVIDGSFGTTPF